MKITHLTYKEIDFTKYDHCIAKAKHTRIYAYSWYLDIVTDKNWEVLVSGDYHMVMPLPFSRIKKRFFKRMVSQPIFCQQLGVFSSEPIEKDTFDAFFKKLHTFPVESYPFNAENRVFLKEEKYIQERVNFELNLKQTKEELKRDYSKSLKNNINKAAKNHFTITTEVASDDLIELKKSNKTHGIKSKYYKVLKNLVEKIQDQQMGNLYAVLYQDAPIAIAFFTKNHGRIINLLLTSNTKGKELGAVPYLFDTVIKEHAQTNTIFDFEGSMIPGVAEFFRSFGPTNHPYAVLMP